MEMFRQSDLEDTIFRLFVFQSTKTVPCVRKLGMFTKHDTFPGRFGRQSRKQKQSEHVGGYIEKRRRRRWTTLMDICCQEGVEALVYGGNFWRRSCDHGLEFVDDLRSELQQKWCTS